MLKQFYRTAAILAVPAAVSAMVIMPAHADESVTTIFGKTKFDALVQFWGVNDTTLNVAQSGQVPASNMKIRRTELGFHGDVTDTTHYGIMVDPIRTSWSATPGTLTTTTPYWESDTGLVRDAWISQQIVIPELEIKVGQFRTPTTSEGLESDAELMFPERSMVARTFGDDYEPGVQIGYKAPMWKLVGMLSNGHGPDVDDYAVLNSSAPALPNGAEAAESSPNSKNLSFRADVKPMDMISGGAFTTLTNFSYDNRLAVGVNVSVTPIEDLLVRFEGVRGRQRVDAANGGTVVTTTGSTSDVSMNGWTVDAGYQYGDFQPVFRYEIQQAQAAGTVNTITGRAITLGLNYFFSKHNYKLQFAYSILNNVNGSAFGSTSAQNATGMYYTEQGYSGGLAVLAFQAAL